MAERAVNQQIGERDREGHYRVNLVCLVCGEPLAAQGRGRPRRYCKDACRKVDARALRKWSREAVKASLAGLPEPARWTWRKGG